MPTTAGAAPADVRSVLDRHGLVDGLPIVLDTDKSQGSWLVDAETGERYLDMYTFFASSPLGMNPPAVVDDPEFLALLGRVAANKPANGDLYVPHQAEFVLAFRRVLGDPELPHLFFIEGGSAAVENALKCAFDWKSRHNETHGRSARLGTRVLHLGRAFHGRGGYTLSLLDDQAKTARFPRFDWPRIDVPAVVHPLGENLPAVERAERRSLAQAEAAFVAHPHDIACFVAEPIQGEGGDNHMRPEFLLAMQALCRRHDALLVLDEVQTGCGTTGTAWAYQQLGLEPDVVAFGKKLQVAGVMAGRRVDEVRDNVFAVGGRVSSTWGGGLTDMVRARRILEEIESRGLIPRAAALGRRVLAGLEELAATHGRRCSNVRGRGLLCAFDAADPTARDDLVRRMRDEMRVLVLPCGERSVRLRPTLAVLPEELDLALSCLDTILAGQAA